MKNQHQFHHNKKHELFKESYITLSDSEKSESSFSDETEKNELINTKDNNNNELFDEQCGFSLNIFQMKFINLISIILLISMYYITFISKRIIFSRGVNAVFIFSVTPIISMCFMRLINIDARTSTDVKRIINSHYKLNFFCGNICFTLCFIFSIIYSKLSILFSLFFVSFAVYFYFISYYTHKSKEQNIIFNTIFDYFSLSYNLSILTAFSYIALSDIMNIIFPCPIYTILLTFISIVLISYYNDIIFCLCCLIYQISLIKRGLTEINGLFALFTLICFAFVCYSLIKKKLPELKEFSNHKKEDSTFGVFFSIGTNYNTTDLENKGYESS